MMISLAEIITNNLSAPAAATRIALLLFSQAILMAYVSPSILAILNDPREMDISLHKHHMISSDFRLWPGLRRDSSHSHQHC
jgi:hypothetical protein